ncbi:MAG: hypothetical protein ABI262_08775 [Microcoleus sp.]|jgi:hypothetical protein
MFYQAPELKGQVFITPSKLNNIDRFHCEIYLEGKLIHSKIDQWSKTRAEAVTEALRIANKLKQEELDRIELETVGDGYYVKYSTDVTRQANQRGIDGFYAVFVKGRKYNISSHLNKEDALAELERITKQDKIDDFYYRHAVLDLPPER